jgi:type II secretory pathway component PulF
MASLHPDIFATLDVTLVDVADTSGNLPEVMKLLSQWYDFRTRLKNKLISGLILPFVLIHIAAFVGPLPFLFMGIINGAGYIMEVAKILVSFYTIIAVILAIFRLMPCTGMLRRFKDTLVLNIPLLRQVIRQLALSRYCRAFNMLYKAGVPITQCARQATGVTGNVIMADLLKGGAESAKAGNMVCEGFSSKLPEDFLSLWSIGEETGELDNCVKRLADNMSERAELLLGEFVKHLTILIYWFICIGLIIRILMGAAAVFGSLSSQ